MVCCVVGAVFRELRQRERSDLSHGLLQSWKQDWDWKRRTGMSRKSTYLIPPPPCPACSQVGSASRYWRQTKGGSLGLQRGSEESSGNGSRGDRLQEVFCYGTGDETVGLEIEDRKDSKGHLPGSKSRIVRGFSGRASDFIAIIATPQGQFTGARPSLSLCRVRTLTHSPTYSET